MIVDVFVFIENYKWWENNSKSKTMNVEITAYALLTFLSTKKESDCIPILKWLLDQRNDRGGFRGTQDTIIGLEALAEFASKLSSKESKLKVQLTTDTSLKHTFEVDSENALVLQTEKVCVCLTFWTIDFNWFFIAASINNSNC